MPWWWPTWRLKLSVRDRLRLSRLNTRWPTNGWKAVQWLWLHGRHGFSVGSTSSPITLLFHDIGLWVQDRMDAQWISRPPFRRRGWWGAGHVSQGWKRNRHVGWVIAAIPLVGLHSWMWVGRGLLGGWMLKSARAIIAVT